MVQYNPQNAGTNFKTRLQDNDGNLDRENPQERAVGSGALQGTGKMKTVLKQPTSKIKNRLKNAIKKAPMVSRTVPGKSYAGAGSSFIGSDPKGVIKPANGNSLMFPKRK